MESKLDDIKQHVIRIEEQLNKVDVKLDSHLERIAKAEVSISWLRGAVKIGASILLAAVSSLMGLLYKLIH